MKMIYNFAEKSELPKFLLPMKIDYWVVSGVECKISGFRAISFSCLAALPLDFVLTATSNICLLAGYPWVGNLTRLCCPRVGKIINIGLMGIV